MKRGFISTLIFVALLTGFNSTALAAIIAANTYQGADNRIISIKMVVLEQEIKNNRLGAAIEHGQIYALARDVVPLHHPMDIYGNDKNEVVNPKNFKAGQVRLRSDKRPRPIVLRANVGDILHIEFTNLLPNNPKNLGLQSAGLQIMGLAWAGTQNDTRIEPGKTFIYKYLATGEGVFMLYSPNGQVLGNNNSQLNYGLFGAVNVQPKEAEWYRSQVTEEDLTLATYKVDDKFLNRFWTAGGTRPCQMDLPSSKTGLPKGVRLKRQWQSKNNDFICPSGGKDSLWILTLPTSKAINTEKQATVVITPEGYLNTPIGQPLINYSAMYPKHHKRANSPILNMLAHDNKSNTYELAHTDLTAIITGPNAGRFPYYLDSPSFRENPAAPDRRQPYREFTIHYHISPNTTQAFKAFNEGPLANTLAAGADGFAVNYGIAGIAPEIYANRINVGPMGINGDGVDLLFEEFFLSAWAVGDPAVLVDIPANTKEKLGEKARGKDIRATKALYADDPSNVYHSYMRDHVKFRVLNTGSVAPHVHHQHAHQWLHTPNSDDSHYLDSQMINPGSTYTLEMVYNGSGNRNQTVGDSIFHCHIYPHFAQGMWAMWRVHDVFEAGTELDISGAPKIGARALPDGEIIRGTPIPGLVPLPSLAMAPMPPKVTLVDNGRRVTVTPIGKDDNGKPVYSNPGYPFFIPGVSGHRAPHPPMDFAWKETKDKKPARFSEEEAQKRPFRNSGDLEYLDGGLPRHLILDGEIASEFHSRWDFSKEISRYTAMEIPELGTEVEKAAMLAHSIRSHASFQPDGIPGNFILNGLPPAPGAPYAAPEVDDHGNSTFNERRYKAAVIQTDVVFSKEGWHYPQQRFITLLEDVKDTIAGKKPPEPFFFRANTGETLEFWHTNLVPNYYQLDDFQVRTPTDILGQHIHLVKFDVTSSDGAGNGFNYEDGTFSPDEVRSRIAGINAGGGLHHFDPATQFKSDKQSHLTPSSYRSDYNNSLGTPPVGQNWDGAQTTIQRFDTDPLLNHQGEDRTLRTVFTHDHYGPSTHQQVGLYGALLVEPEGSTWYDAVTRAPMPNPARNDGGPTSWQAIIETYNSEESYREFALAMGDLQLAYTKDSPAQLKPLTTVWFTENLTEKDKQKVLRALNNKIIPPQLRQAFSDQGGILSDKASVEVLRNNELWKIYRYSADAKHNDQFTLTLKDNTIEIRIPQLSSWASIDHAIWPPTAAQIPSDSPNNNFAPFPTIISDPGGSGNIGTWVANYRTEPVDARIQSGTNKNATAQATDPAFAYSSIERHNAALNTQPKLGSPIGSDKKGFRFPQKPLVPEGRDGVQGTDPYTPLLRAYANENIEVRAIVGAVDSVHSFHIEGVNWLAEPTYENSGFRDTQGMGISEHFEMQFKLPPASNEAGKTADFVDYLYAPSGSNFAAVKGTWGIMRAYNKPVKNLAGLTTRSEPMMTVKDFYKPQPGAATQHFNVEVSLNTANNQLQFSVNGLPPTSPLILRARAGDWIALTLKNLLTEAQVQALTTQWAGQQSSNASSSTIKNYHASAQIGVNPMLVAYDAANASGLNIGFNPISSVAPQSQKTFYWYAGNIALDKKGKRILTPVEFGGVNLVASDPILQQSYGFFGALIIEPEHSQWAAAENHNLSVVVTDNKNRPLFTEVVVTGNVAPKNTEVAAGTEVRMRVLNPNVSGTPGQVTNSTHLITVEGHSWEEEPYTHASKVIGHNPLTQILGTQQVTPLESYNLVLPKAGGEKAEPGNYAFYYYPQGPCADVPNPNPNSKVIPDCIMPPGKNQTINNILGSLKVIPRP